MTPHFLAGRMRGVRLASTTLALALAACGQSAPESPAQPASASPAPTAEHTRHVALEGALNFRDLGGYAAADGRSVKWGELYRSDELPHLTDEDVEILEARHITTVVNFLQPTEIELKGEDRLPPATREVRTPIGGRVGEMSIQVQGAIRRGDFDALPPEMNPDFHAMLAVDGAVEYADLLRMAIDADNRPLVFHCSHGVHRTGTATAILLSALGVPWETVREDYLLSNQYRASDIDAQLARIRDVVAERRGVPPDEVDMANVEAFYRLEAHYIDGTLNYAVAMHGSMEAYIRDGLGITDEEIAQLRAQLLE